MMRTTSLLFFAVAACATEPAPTELDEAADEQPWIADVTVPTADGAAHYRFRFGEVGGTIVTAVDSPIGYPVAEVPDECALDTYLRVADPAAVVPQALLRACDPGATLVPRELAPTRTVGELRTPEHELRFAAAIQPLCTRAAYDDRIDELWELARYQPTVPFFEWVCTAYVAWNFTGCGVFDQDHNLIYTCAPEYWAELVFEHGAIGEQCLNLELVPAGSGPDPDCAHFETVIPDWGPWGVWERFSLSESQTTRTRVELSPCSTVSLQLWWQYRNKQSDPWSAKSFINYPGNTFSVLTLSAGWDNSDRWLGSDYRVHVTGNNFHVGYARVELRGKNRFECPLAI